MMFTDSDTYDDKHRATDTPPPTGGGLELFGDSLAADGDPTKFTRQRPNGRLVGPDAERTEFGVDRTPSGEFASRDRDPTPQVRDADGTLGSDAFAVGNAGTFDAAYDWGDR